MSTPKKRKTTWHGLLKSVVGDVPGDIDLESLLAEEDADVFVLNSKRGQRFILKGLLVGQDDLIERVLTSVEQAYRTPQTQVERLLSYTLAPSASQTMDETTLLCIAGSLLNKPIQFESDRIKLLASLGKPSLESFSIPEVYTESLLVFYKEQEETAVGLRRKEVSGIPVLGAFLACVVKLLNGQKQEHSVARYLYELEFTVMKASGTPGKNPATDGAVFVAVHVSSPSTLQPVIIYAYKPVVDPQLTVVERKDLTELLIQGFYCFHQYNIDDCLLCLTDLYRFHYMKVTKAAPRMAIKWAKSISFSFEEKQRQKQMQEHFSFIAAAIA